MDVRRLREIHDPSLPHRYRLAMSLASRISEWLPILWFALVVVLLLLLWETGTLSKLGQRITKFGGFGLSFEFTEESARQTRKSIEGGLSEVRSTITRRVASEVRSANLPETFIAMLDHTMLNGKADYRATIHITDPLFANQLLQLLDYHPRGGGAGRTFSARAGIIGWAWRNRETDDWSQPSAVTPRELMGRWGMTRQEADVRQATDSKKLFLAVPLFDRNGARIAVFYFDAGSRTEIGLSKLDEGASDVLLAAARVEDQKQLRELAAQITTQYEIRMAEKLTLLVAELAKTSPLLELEAV